VKKKYNEGFSLVEVLLAMTILAMIVIPTCSGIVMAFRMNAKSEELMQAQLAVSSAVETLMAEGIEAASVDYGVSTVDDETEDRFPEVQIVTAKANDDDPFYTVTVTSNDGEVSVETVIREKGGST